jgi:hypothetical protein
VQLVRERARRTDAWLLRGQRLVTGNADRRAGMAHEALRLIACRGRQLDVFRPVRRSEIEDRREIPEGGAVGVDCSARRSAAPHPRRRGVAVRRKHRRYNQFRRKVERAIARASAHRFRAAGTTVVPLDRPQVVDSIDQGSGLEVPRREATGGSAKALPLISLAFCQTPDHPRLPRAATHCQSFVSRLSPLEEAPLSIAAERTGGLHGFRSTRLR